MKKQSTYSFVCFIFDIVPHGPPLNLKGNNTVEQKIALKWDEVNVQLKNGIIVGYKVFYKSMKLKTNPEIKKDVNWT